MSLLRRAKQAGVPELIGKGLSWLGGGSKVVGGLRAGGTAAGAAAGGYASYKAAPADASLGTKLLYTGTGTVAGGGAGYGAVRGVGWAGGQAIQGARSLANPATYTNAAKAAPSSAARYVPTAGAGGWQGYDMGVQAREASRANAKAKGIEPDPYMEHAPLIFGGLGTMGGGIAGSLLPKNYGAAKDFAKNYPIRAATTAGMSGTSAIKDFAQSYYDPADQRSTLQKGLGAWNQGVNTFAGLHYATNPAMRTGALGRSMFGGSVGQGVDDALSFAGIDTDKHLPTYGGMARTIGINPDNFGQFGHDIGQRRLSPQDIGRFGGLFSMPFSRLFQGAATPGAWAPGMMSAPAQAAGQTAAGAAAPLSAAGKAIMYPAVASAALPLGTGEAQRVLGLGGHMHRNEMGIGDADSEKLRYQASQLNPPKATDPSQQITPEQWPQVQKQMMAESERLAQRPMAWGNYGLGLGDTAQSAPRLAVGVASKVLGISPETAMAGLELAKHPEGAQAISEGFEAWQKGGEEGVTNWIVDKAASNPQFVNRVIGAAKNNPKVQKLVHDNMDSVAEMFDVPAGLMGGMQAFGQGINTLGPMADKVLGLFLPQEMNIGGMQLGLGQMSNLQKTALMAGGIMTLLGGGAAMMGGGGMMSGMGGLGGMLGMVTMLLAVFGPFIGHMLGIGGQQSAEQPAAATQTPYGPRTGQELGSPGSYDISNESVPPKSILSTLYDPYLTGNGLPSPPTAGQ